MSRNNAARRPTTVHNVNPPAGRVGKSTKVLRRGEPLCLEAPHLAWRSRAALSRFAANDPAHRRIMPQALGVVHILISGKATKFRLPQQTHQRMAAVLPGAHVGERLARQRVEAPMKVNIEIECTPLEARQFFGLPNVEPMQAAVMQQLEQRM